MFIHSFALPETLGTNSYSGLLIDYQASNSLSPTLLWDLVKLFGSLLLFVYLENNLPPWVILCLKLYKVI